MLFPESSLNRRPSTLLILDHVLTTTYNNRPHLTTFFGDCFDDFNKRDNQLGVKSLIASNKHTIIPAFHQHLSSRPRHAEKDSGEAVFFYLIFFGINAKSRLFCIFSGQESSKPKNEVSARAAHITYAPKTCRRMLPMC